MVPSNFDYDFVIIGSGFGGSVSALRLSEKGYRVAVLEKGKRYRPQDFAITNWNLRRYLWAPMLRCFGIQKLTLFRHVLVLSGAGVGGGSLVYANTLLEPGDSFFSAPSWAHLDQWKDKLAPFYKTAKRMLGVVPNPKLTDVDAAMKEVAHEMGRDKTFHSVDVAVYFGEPGKEGQTVADPFFGGEGPARAGCVDCGGCMVGCRYNAKNTLDKNYLWFAEKKGAKIIPETEVVKIVPLNEDGSAGYEIVCKSSTALWSRRTKPLRTRGVVSAGGVLGTLKLLFNCKEVYHTLPKISDRLGMDIRTNSEALIGLTTRKTDVDWSKGIAITAGFYADDNTHIETVRYSKGSSFMRLLAAPMADEGPAWVRTLQMLASIVLRPLDTLQLLFNTRWAENTVILLVMQTLDNKLNMKRCGKWLATKMEKGQKLPSCIPVGHKVARSLAQKLDGIPLSAVNEVVLQIPTTAHILGGCGIGDSPATGVVDKDQRVFGYSHFYVCDGSVIPANLGVNPSLTITAMTEFAMSKVGTSFS